MQPIHERESPELDSPTDEFFSSKVRLQSHVRPRFQQGLLRSHTQKKTMNASFHHAESNGSNESSGGWRTPSKLVRLEFEQCCLPWEDEYGNSARHALHRFASVQRPQEVRNCARPQKYTVYAVYHYIYMCVYVYIYHSINYIILHSNHSVFSTSNRIMKGCECRCARAGDFVHMQKFQGAANLIFQLII